jgi:hypothetical protein
MDRTNAGERAFATAPTEAEAEAIEFVRFCHRRRRVGWPELYDEMCAVAGRGLYRGYGPEELATIGIGLGLFQMPAMAGLAAKVVAEDQESRRRTAAAIRASHVAATESSLDVEPAGAGDIERTDSPAAGRGSIRIAVPAGA